MADINLMALGMSGSGKTCFLLGMYYEMSAGVNGYTLSMDNDMDAVELQRKWKKLCEEQGKNRFPTGTDNISKYLFCLEYAHQPIKKFQWVDYRGGILESKGTGDSELEEYEELKQYINDSTCLLIFVDGDYLAENDDEKIIRNIKNKLGTNINQIFSRYRDENGKLPPIVIVITKYDKCGKYVDKEKVPRLIKKAFSSLFTTEKGENPTAIIPVSIGQNIENENYSGSLEPTNIYKPLFFGIYIHLIKELKALQDEYKKIYDLFIPCKATLEEEANKLNKYLQSKGDIWNAFHKKQKREIENSLKSGEEKSQQYENYLKAQEERIKKLEEYIKKIQSELDGTPVFFKGRDFNIEKGENYDIWGDY